MPAADAGEVLALPPRLDADAAARLYREWAPRAASLARLDFAAVQQLDSAGVALVQALQDAARQRGREIELRALPARFEQLCLAHRLALGGH